eukprot:jgi/Mesen1/3192/ME000184S02242
MLRDAVPGEREDGRAPTTDLCAICVASLRGATLREGKGGEGGDERQAGAAPCRRPALCVENLGRPAGTALHEFVTAAVEAALAGYARDKLALQLNYGASSSDNEFSVNAAGEQVYITLQRMGVVPTPAPSAAGRETAGDDQFLHSIIYRVLEGQRTGEEQSLVKFDRALATGGASGGAAAEKAVIAPQWVPISQLVLLTMKVVAETHSREERA